MSHAQAEFKFSDGTVLYGEYNGTADIQEPAMYATKEEMDANWRNGEWKECKCGQPPEPCVATSYYGGGFSWDGTACRRCMAFIGPLSDFNEREQANDN